MKKAKGTLYLTLNADPMGLLAQPGHPAIKMYRSDPAYCTTRVTIVVLDAVPEVASTVMG
jgi:hypothetical protein